MAALVACLAQLQHRVDRNVVLRQWNAPPGAGGWGGGGVEGGFSKSTLFPIQVQSRRRSDTCFGGMRIMYRIRSPYARKVEKSEGRRVGFTMSQAGGGRIAKAMPPNDR